jgi:acyl-CoA dehydrogenase
MHRPAKHSDVTGPADRPGLLAPDTSGMNFYHADPALTDLLRIHLRMDNEAEARRATSLLYHVASVVALAWEGGRIHEMGGDARRLLLSRLVIDHRVQASDPFRLTENPVRRAITDHRLGERAVGMAEVGELLKVA